MFNLSILPTATGSLLAEDDVSNKMEILYFVGVESAN